MLSALLQRLKSWWGQPLMAQTICCTQHQIGVHGYHPRESLYWRRHPRKPANCLLKTCQQSTWITGSMSYGLMRWRLICLVLMASSMCGNVRLRSTKISLSCLQSSMMVGISRFWATCVLLVLESYILLRETSTPTCTVKYCSRAWSPPSRNWVAGQFSNMTRTQNVPPRRLLLYWRGCE